MSDRAATADRIHYVGHATVLIELDGTRILTDPVLRGRIGHLRRIAPAPDPGRLGDLDAILVSHAHHDHLDVSSLRRLRREPEASRVLCPELAARAVPAGAETMEPGDRVAVGPLTVEATEADHDGRRWPWSSGSRSLGFVVRGSSRAVYFAGDTGLFEAMAEIRGVDVALLPVAGWGPNLGPGHIGPEEAAEAAALIAPRVAIPIHWGTLRRMGMRDAGAPDAPARRFLEALAEAAPDVRGELLQPGATLPLP